MKSSDTLLFKYICPDYSTFIESPVAIETIPEIAPCYKYENDKRVLVPYSEYMPTIFRLLFRRFKNWQIAYENESDFLDSLWETLEMHIPNYIERKSQYERLLSLPDSELLSQGYSIANYVEHTDSEVEDPLNTVLSGITNQNSSKNFADKGSRLRQVINTAKYNIKNDFLDKFKWLFLKIGSFENISG